MIVVRIPSMDEHRDWVDRRVAKSHNRRKLRTHRKASR